MPDNYDCALKYIQIALSVFNCTRLQLGIVPEAMAKVYSHLSWKEEGNVTKSAANRVETLPFSPDSVTEIDIGTAQFVAVVEDKNSLLLLVQNMTDILSHGILLSSDGKLGRGAYLHPCIYSEENVILYFFV